MAPSNAVVLLGHSHLGAIRHAFDLRKEASKTLPPARFFLHDVWAKNIAYADSAPGGGVAFDKDMLTLLKDTIPAGAKTHFVSAFGGNGYVVLGLTKSERNFDFVLPEYPDLPFDHDAEIVPYGYFLESLKPLMMPYIWQMIAFRQAIGQRFVCLETPPVYGDSEYVRSHLGSYIVDPNNIVPATTRFKLWRAHSYLLKCFCEMNDIEFMPAPAASIGSDGYLVREAYGEDATHANAWYGNLVIRQIEERFGVGFEDHLIFS